MKKDMSSSCGLCQEAMWAKREEGVITDEQFAHWYNNHCAMCLHESEVCMYQGNTPPIDVNKLLALHPELAYMFE